MALDGKYKCKYCNKTISFENSMCSDCKKKLELVRKLLRMVKNAAETKVNDCDRH